MTTQSTQSSNMTINGLRRCGKESLLSSWCAQSVGSLNKRTLQPQTVHSPAIHPSSTLIWIDRVMSNKNPMRMPICALAISNMNTTVRSYLHTYEKQQDHGRSSSLDGELTLLRCRSWAFQALCLQPCVQEDGYRSQSQHASPHPCTKKGCSGSTSVACARDHECAVRNADELKAEARWGFQKIRGKHLLAWMEMCCAFMYARL